MAGAPCILRTNLLFGFRLRRNLLQRDRHLLLLVWNEQIKHLALRRNQSVIICLQLTGEAKLNEHMKMLKAENRDFEHPISAPYKGLVCLFNR